MKIKKIFLAALFVLFHSESTAQVTIDACAKHTADGYKYSYVIHNNSEYPISEIMIGYSSVFNEQTYRNVEEYKLKYPPSKKQALHGDVHADNFTAPAGWQLYNLSEEDNPGYSARFSSMDFFNQTEAANLTQGSITNFSIINSNYDSWMIAGPAMIKFDFSGVATTILNPDPILLSYRPVSPIAPLLNISVSPSVIPADGLKHDVSIAVEVNDKCDPSPRLYLESITELSGDNLSSANGLVFISNAEYLSDDRTITIAAMPRSDDVKKSRRFEIVFVARNVSQILTRAKAILEVRSLLSP